MPSGGATIPDFSQTNIHQTFPDLKNKRLVHVQGIKSYMTNYK